ncbi:MAG: hypothetical protein HY996_03550 [Micrococcales bacterium]|nr:hypothetical protein [Micrococcales bacterium]
MTGERPTARMSAARTGILVAILAVATLAFTPWLGPFRLPFRLLLVLGVLALIGSYLWPRWQRIRTRLSARRRA